jgi:hypothetical protein
MQFFYSAENPDVPCWADDDVSDIEPSRRSGRPPETGEHRAAGEQAAGRA